MKVEKFLPSIYRPDQAEEEVMVGEDTCLSLVKMVEEAKHRHVAETEEKQ